MKARELMTPSPVTSRVEDAAIKMKEFDVGALPVVSPDGLCGILTDRDIVLKTVAVMKGAMTQVGEVCTPSAVTVDPETEIEDVASVLKKYQVRRVLVVEDGNVVGIVSLGDLALARQSLAGETLAGISQSPGSEHGS